MKFGTKNVREITKEVILETISEYDIFNHYIISLEGPNKPFCSELRKDHSPTCRVSLLGAGWIYKDFGTGDTYTCFTYVMEKYNLKYTEALRVISIDFGLGLTYKEVAKKAKIPIQVLTGGGDLKPKENVDIKIVSKPWTSEGLEYWEEYGINQTILETYSVVQLAGYYMNHKYFNTKELAFCYQFGNFRYKILKPDNDFKWITNASSSIVQGLAQLKPGGLLFITSSLKDVMTLHGLGYKAIAPQSENTLIKRSLFKKLKENFSNIVIYYNNDQPGIEAARDHSVKYGVEYIRNPEGEPKDPSDYVKQYNKESLKQLLEHYGF
jgi:hypothetical protein